MRMRGHVVGLVWPSVHAVVATGLAILAAAGVFLSVFKLPLYFGASWAAVALLSFVFRPFRSKAPVLLLIWGMAFSMAAPLVQDRVNRSDLARRESAAMEVLSTIVAPPLRYSRVMNAESVEIPEKGVVVLNFWATWCPPCLEEMPLLDDFSRSAGSVTVIGVTSLDGDPEAAWTAIQEFVSTSGVTFPIAVADDWTNQKAYEVHTLPATLLIDDGRITDYSIGIEGTKRILGKANRASQRHQS